MPACGSCGYSGIDETTRYCPRCGETLGSGAPVEAAVEADEEVRTPVYKKESSKEVKEEKAYGIGCAPGEENAKDDTRSGITDTTVSRNKKGREIAGWLFLPGYQLVVGTLGELLFLVMAASIANDVFINVPSNKSIGLHLFSAFFCLTELLIFIRYALVGTYFLARLAKAPKAITQFFWLLFFQKLITGIWLSDVAIETSYTKEEFISLAFSYFIFAIIYTIAFRRSKRAKATFVN